MSQPAAAQPVEPLIKLSGSFKPPSDKSQGPRPPPAYHKVPLPVRGDATAMPLPPPPRPSGAQSLGQGTETNGMATEVNVTGPLDDDDDDLNIPDEETIRLVKAKRERLRQAHLAPDYVPLGGAGKLTSRDFKLDVPARAEADEGGSDEDLEEHMRMQFLGKAKISDKQHYSKAVPDDDEEEAFAQAQLRKAIRRNQGLDQGTGDPPQGQPGYHSGAGPGGSGYHAAAASPMSLYTRSKQEQITAAADGVVTALQEGLRHLQASHRNAKQNLERNRNHLDNALSSIDRTQQELKVASAKYMFIQQLKQYISDLCDCLADKSVLVEELEDTMREVREDRGQAVAEKERTLSGELMRVAEGAVQGALQVLSRGGGAAAATVAAEAAAKDAAGSHTEMSTSEVDEFGRNVSLQRKREAEEQAKEQARVVKQELELMDRLAQGEPVLDAGFSSDGTESEAIRYKSRRQEVLDASATVFADAADEFSDVETVKRRLEECKFRYPKEYRQAYFSESIAALLAPYVRLELLQWDPLFSGGDVGLDRQGWYECLFSYGLPEDPSRADPDDPDCNLVPQLIQKLVLPKIHHMLARCWDPFNLDQSFAAARLLELVFVYVPAEEERVQEVLELVVGTVKSTVEEMALPAWPSAARQVSPVAVAAAFRRFRKALVLLKGLSAFDGILSTSLLVSTLLGQLVQNSLLSYLRSYQGNIQLAVSLSAAVALAVPATWFSTSAVMECRALVDWLVVLGTRMGKMAAEGLDLGPGARPVVGALVRALKHTGRNVEAQQLSSTFDGRR